MKTFQISLLLVALIFSGCRKDIEIIDDQFIPIGEGELISTKFMGQVVNQAGLAISDATVRLGQLKSITNQDGVYSFAKMDLRSNGQLVTVEKEGFFTSYKKIIPSEKQTFFKITLVTKSEATGQFSAAEGGTIAKPNGERITFQPNSIRTESNEDYQGTVTVLRIILIPRDSNSL